MTFNHRVILRTISVILQFVGVAMIAPFICAFIYDERHLAITFLAISLCCIIVGFIFFKNLQYNTLNIKTREGYFVVLITWLIICLVGALPYWFSGNGYSFTDSIFESVAGWATTGGWVINVNTMPKSLILWRAVSNWLGGMGIIVLTLSIFPILGIGGQKMAAAEVPGPELSKLSARIGDTAKISYRIYIALTLLQLILLLPSGLSPYDALVNTLSTISTSGIINIRGGIGLHYTPYVKCIFTVFSIVGSINFGMYFFIYMGKWKELVRNIELRTYLCILAVASIIMAITLFVCGNYDTFSEAFGNSIAQSVSFGSTSGFNVANVNTWPTLCKVVLLLLILIGGCSFSTSGSIKVIRFVVFFKLIVRGIYKRIHPNAVKPIMLQKTPISAENASSITVFLLLYFAVFITSSILLGLENQDMETTLSAALAAFSNNGTGFGLVNNGDFSIFSNFGKWICSILMLAGRLEMYSIIIIFSRSFWNSDRAIS